MLYGLPDSVTMDRCAKNVRNWQLPIAITPIITAPTKYGDRHDIWPLMPQLAKSGMPCSLH